MAAWPPGAGGLKAVKAAAVKGAILDVDSLPGGVAALVTRRVGGLGYDRVPTVAESSDAPGPRHSDATGQ